MLRWRELVSKNPLQSMIIIGGIFLIIGLLLGRVTKSPLIIRNKVLRESGYKYINPVLLCNINPPQSYNENIEISKAIENYAKKNLNNTLSVYYLNLNGGGWASYNENESFSPASMLKVPTSVDALKYAEINPDILTKEVYFDGSFDDNAIEYFKPIKSIIPGKSYSINDLISYTIKYSDNNALRLIHNNIDASALESLYKDLNIEIPQNSIDFMSVKTYSLFLRVLYNSTYLNRELSENILSLMTYPDFPNGIRGGVPSDVDVASKFGERQVFDQQGKLIKRELHDCGIVYLQDKNYILCVMTSGKDFDSLTNNIKDVSAIIYSALVK
jgi:beta-lactamase class A